MNERPVEIYQQFAVDDAEKLKASQLAILNMVRAKIEEGQVASMAFLLVAKDPAVSGDRAYTGSRFLVQAAHLDLVDDVYRQMMAALQKQYGVTPDELRADRNRKKA